VSHLCIVVDPYLAKLGELNMWHRGHCNGTNVHPDLLVGAIIRLVIVLIRQYK